MLMVTACIPGRLLVPMRDRSVLESGIASVGAVICGRRTYDDSLKWWQENGPTGPVRLPVVVLTHEVPAEQLTNSVYHFEQSVDEAVSAAKRLASGRISS